MTYPDPFDDRSPWDEKPETPANEEKPLPNSTSGNPPFEIGVTLKAASGFDAEWLTPRVSGHTAEETARRGAELLAAMKNEGLIDYASKAAAYAREQYKGGGGNPGGGGAPKNFSGGRVQRRDGGGGQAAPQVAGDGCPHGRSLVSKANWSALFCNGEDGDKCEPLWKQKDGSFKANK
ncbi:hypothetical protein GTY75_04955 [Streptomyces sp. SID8381]|uniref:hypothetical protein n=1 Tax=unclassified Streptomyces TaxID=2593676 RepID=UPI000376F447|nr:MULTISPECIES: hypothetical protein [unclassified Streptomyces]MYX26023.1 hypothetical protein [Streptomyces sp. SID8381]